MTPRRREYPEETVAELLRMLSPAPPAWVAAAKELPAARREIRRVGEHGMKELDLGDRVIDHRAEERDSVARQVDSCEGKGPR
jgi:hypothetical protein